MPRKIIKNQRVIDDSFEIITTQVLDSSTAQANSLVPLSIWNTLIDNTQRESLPAGLWLDSHEAPEEISGNPNQALIIAINFPAFTDGRGYSLARLLRQQYRFTGELRAIGDIHRDQLYYLSRCGFDSFALADPAQSESAIESLEDFSVAYQHAGDSSTPVIR
ncbi:DUF934 domain-containing protein [Kistimonas asteriae]|uniref:DUF934 domain-containing protein n=1 Tax=Kistimonas asteriae TaxID=517724 RepID=UPI001BA9521F|nr:DUF934 domain-containing protein [Kistimonas asteriae]